MKQLFIAVCVCICMVSCGGGGTGRSLTAIDASESSDTQVNTITQSLPSKINTQANIMIISKII